ncbi:WecB/TagA/CpsF family glycosyltransferase [Clostridium perfringens]|uniref:WecB/TagA/CpsF family glycosyltransferase n=1 Tax=Clostridium perfringens TaxID=1502 RepID=UPI001CCD15D8|nr:WecB/TagA/CpsF family glycosyltransferase [Clostridium perfringens]MDK0835429.1 WecB/TagA/CpsF family glycosyltransferase [Clostridium perfringens]MDM0937428.1 WecB/TagA/CpsF family glycosyltransferase [Clostridium perfringens]
MFNIEIDNISMDECIEKIDDLINNGKFNYLVTPNVDHIVKLDKDDEFLKVYNNADLIVTDGMPIIWYSKIIKRPIKEKISGSDLFPKICELSAQKGYKIFLLGASEGVADIAKKKLQDKYKGLNIVGVYSPKYGFEDDEIELNKIINIVKKSNTDILAVGLGAPKQEKFIFKYKDILQVPLSLAIGATIDFEAGNVKRAPKWMQNSGLEWFYRLIKEPKRMYKRYILDDRRILRLMINDYRKQKKIRRSI